MSNYPATVMEVLDDNMGFPPAVLSGVRAFARSRPWTGPIDERKGRFSKLNHDLAAAYGIREPELVFGILDGSNSGESHYIPRLHRIVLVGRLSVVSMLHEWGHVLGYDERDATAYSVNLFKRVFPRQFAKLAHEGHMLLARLESGTGPG